MCCHHASIVWTQVVCIFSAPRCSHLIYNAFHLQLGHGPTHVQFLECTNYNHIVSNDICAKLITEQRGDGLHMVVDGLHVPRTVRVWQ
jgi:hypothetical protein